MKRFVIVVVCTLLGIQEKIPRKNREEKFVSLAVVAPSEQALLLCLVKG